MKRVAEYSNIVSVLIVVLVSCIGGSLFFSCDAASGFLLDVDDELLIETIVPGAILKNGDEVPINLDFNESIVSPDYLEVQFFSKEGESLGKFELEYQFRSNASFPTPVVADTLEPGEYLLTLLIKEGTTVLKEKEIKFFLVDRDVRILSVNTTPSQVKPGSDVLLSINLSAEASGYFVRWKFKDRILKEDFLDVGGNNVTFKAPNLEGIYVVRVEIFPGKVEAEINSSIYSHGEILVTEDSLNNDYELSEEDKFTLLYHFAGDLKNSGQGIDNDIASRSEGKFIPMQKEGNFGYLFDQESRLLAPFTVFPVNGQGEVESFAICGQIAPYRASKSGVLFFMEDGKGETSLKISYNGTGRLTALFSENGDNRALSLPLRADEKLSWIVLSVLFTDNHVTLSWYINGKLKLTSMFSSHSPKATSGGFAVLGDPDGSDKKERGFNGFIGDWGVFKTQAGSSDGSDDLSELLNRIVQLIYRDRLLYLNRFDRPIDAKRIGLINNKSINVKEGTFSLGRGSLLSIPPFIPKEGTTRVVVDSIPSTTGVRDVFLRFWPADGVGVEGKLYYETPLNSDQESTEVDIVVDQSEKTIIFKSKGTEKEKREWLSSSVVCTIEHSNPDGVMVSLDSIMVIVE